MVIFLSIEMQSCAVHPERKAVFVSSKGHAFCESKCAESFYGQPIAGPRDEEGQLEKRLDALEMAMKRLDPSFVAPVPASTLSIFAPAPPRDPNAKPWTLSFAPAPPSDPSAKPSASPVFAPGPPRDPNAKPWTFPSFAPAPPSDPNAKPSAAAASGPRRVVAIWIDHWEKPATYYPRSQSAIDAIKSLGVAEVVSVRKAEEIRPNDIVFITEIAQTERVPSDSRIEKFLEIVTAITNMPPIVLFGFYKGPDGKPEPPRHTPQIVNYRLAGDKIFRYFYNLSKGTFEGWTYDADKEQLQKMVMYR